MQNRLWTKIAACFAPVLVNAVIVGAVIAASTVQGGAFWSALLVNGAQVGLGELAVMYLIGLPLMLWLPKSHVFTEISQRLDQRNGGDS